MPYLTPDLVVDSPVTCRTIHVPGFLLHLVTGALHTLTLPYSYEENGDMSADDVAGVMNDMFFEYLDSSGGCMVGEVKMWMLEEVPDKYVKCDGRSLSTVDYPDLFALFNYRFGYDSGDFVIPNLNGMLLRGSQPSGSINPDSPGDTLEPGWVAGSREFSVQPHNLPAHSHMYLKSTQLPGLASPGPDPLFVAPGETLWDSQDNSTTHTPIKYDPRCVAVNYIIKVLP